MKTITIDDKKIEISDESYEAFKRQFKESEVEKYPDEVCRKCGLEANRLTCLKKYGEEPLKPCFDVSTFHEGTCDVCGKHDSVTEPRDYFYPDFSLLESSE